MLDGLFRPGQSPLRRASILLSVALVVIGLVLVATEGPATGIPVALVGIVAGLVLSRVVEHREAKAAASEQLHRVTAEVDDAALTQLVDNARAGHGPALPLSELTPRDESEAAAKQTSAGADPDASTP